MVGKSNLPLRTGGYIIPVESSDSTNKILTVNVPAGSRILCTACTLENQSTLSSNGSILATTNGFVINKDINGLKILRPLDNTSPLSIIKGHEILYCDSQNKIINLSSPLKFRRAVVYRNELHVLMGETTTIHYKWDGLNWYEVSILPYGAQDSRVIVFEDEIHLISGTLSNTTVNHYKWNGTTWTKMTAVPNSQAYLWPFIYNNELHIIGHYQSTGSSPKTSLHHKWNGTEWVQDVDLPYYLSHGVVVEHNGKVHSFGGNGNPYNKYHYIFDGTIWTKSTDLPIIFGDGTGVALVYNNEIHVLGGTTSSTKHYKWVEATSSWEDVSTLPFPINKCAVCVYDGKIQLISSNTEEYKNKHYEWDGVTWKDYKQSTVFNLPKGFRVNGYVCVNTGENLVSENNNYLIEY